MLDINFLGYGAKKLKTDMGRGAWGNNNTVSVCMKKTI